MKYLLIILPMFLLVSSCYYDNFSEMHPGVGLVQTCNPDTTDVTYAKDIQPIMAEACGSNNSCHKVSGSDSDVSLASYDDVVAVASIGQLVSSIIWDGNNNPMPKGSTTKLDDCRLNKIIAWVNQGLKP